jgi:hypothetical protein
MKKTNHLQLIAISLVSAPAIEEDLIFIEKGKEQLNLS